MGSPLALWCGLKFFARTCRQLVFCKWIIKTSFHLWFKSNFLFEIVSSQCSSWPILPGIVKQFQYFVEMGWSCVLIGHDSDPGKKPTWKMNFPIKLPQPLPPFFLSKDQNLAQTWSFFEGGVHRSLFLWIKLTLIVTNLKILKWAGLICAS